MRLRAYRPGEEAAMLRLMYETIHSLNAADYSPAQLAAWCPAPLPPPAQLAARRARFAANHTLLAVQDAPGQPCEKQLLGWADMDYTGYLDHLFVEKHRTRRGVAGALLAALQAEATRLGLAKITVYSSITARPFFEKQGFVLVRPNLAEVNGQRLVNFFMEKPL